MRRAAGRVSDPKSLFAVIIDHTLQAMKYEQHCSTMSNFAHGSWLIVEGLWSMIKGYGGDISG